MTAPNVSHAVNTPTTDARSCINYSFTVSYRQRRRKLTCLITATNATAVIKGLIPRSNVSGEEFERAVA
jgi:hypothetical protein